MVSSRIIGAFALFATAFTTALPVQGTPEGMIGQVTKTQAQDGSYHITNLMSSNLYVIEPSNVTDNVVTFTIHDATNDTLTSACDFKWPVGGAYYVDTYTPCQQASFQFRIKDGSFTNISSFSIEIEHARAATQESNGQEIPGGNVFATAPVVPAALNCKSLRGGMDCLQTGSIDAEVTALDG